MKRETKEEKRLLLEDAIEMLERAEKHISTQIASEKKGNET